MRILVPEAHAMGSIACIRSLGRAGHHVVAMSDQPDALGFHSRYTTQTVLLPQPAAPAAVADAIRAAIAAHDIDLVLPSEGLVGVLGSRLGEIADKLPCGPDPALVRRYVSKYELFKRFLKSDDGALRAHLPATRLLDRSSDLGAGLAGLQAPLFAKFDASDSQRSPALVLRYATVDDAARALPPLLTRYGRGLVQEWVPGQGVGVFFLRWNGRVLGELMHRRLHEVPHTGGVSSYRETWWDAALHADALRRIEAMDWWGVGMLEYRYAGPASFHLMEFNARFWGSLHLALFAGVDFPRLLVDAWAGRDVTAQRARAGVRCRLTFPKELEYLWSVLRDHAVGAPRKLGAIVEALALSFDPRVHADLWFPRDRGLYWLALRRTPARFLRRA